MIKGETTGGELPYNIEKGEGFQLQGNKYSALPQGCACTAITQPSGHDCTALHCHQAMHNMYIHMVPDKGYGIREDCMRLCI